MHERVKIEADGLSAVIARMGAELTSLRDAGGSEVLWQAGPEWPRHAPVLFPIVGRLANDTLRHRGETYELPQHGFARDLAFDIVDAAQHRVKMRLRDGDLTHLRYPFPFCLDQIYAIEAATLTVTTRVENPSDEPIACGVGAHPGFRWPLVDGVPKDRHRITFETQETGHALGVEAGLLTDEKPLPFDGRALDLSEALFASDALVMPDVASRALTFEAIGEDGAALRRLAFAFEGYKDLGLWSKPGGAPFLCIEPWYSMASPVGFDGDIMDKPGILVLGAGESRDFVWRVTV